MCGSILTKTCCSWVMTIWSCHMTMCNRKVSGRDELLLSVPVTGFFFALSSSLQGNIESYTYWDGKFQIIIGVGLHFYLYFFKGRTQNGLCMGERIYLTVLKQLRFRNTHILPQCNLAHRTSILWLPCHITL